MTLRHAIVLVSAVCLYAEIDAAKEEAWVANRRNYWAFQRPVRPPGGPKTIDGFLLDALKVKGLGYSPELDREHILRRVTLDLTGLSPTPGERDAFLADPSPQAYQRVVDRLMASPRYGERWALKWLDVVRYADTNGFEGDRFRTSAWRYRDYVIDAFNSGKPYDRFLMEQLAGDQLFPGDESALIATGFVGLGPVHIFGGVQDKEQSRHEVVTEMTAAIGPVFLGMTVGCARCHNHKFDPILQSDYYRLQSIFAATEMKEIPIATPAQQQAATEAKKIHEAKLKPLQDAVAQIEKPYRERLRAKKLVQLDPALRAALDKPKDQQTEEDRRLAKDAAEQLKVTWDELIPLIPEEEKRTRAGLRQQIFRLNQHQPDAAPAAFVASEIEGEPPPTHILKVGDYKAPTDVVEPGFLKVLARESPVITTNRRAAIAKWIASPDHPLTARVMVNRIWQLRMNTGLVGTPNDFGVLGQRPTNVKLLDFLALEFMDRNWSIKAIDRMIVLSQAYRQAATGDAEKAKIDPENKLYWRMDRKRLESEFLRDNILGASGLLNLKAGGRPVWVPLEQEVYDQLFTEGERDHLWPETADAAEHTRRSLYLLNKRNLRLPLLAGFDQPDTMTSCPVRSVSTHALQSLTLFNSDFMQQQSAAFSQRLRSTCGDNRNCQIQTAYLLALARAPKPVEVDMAASFLTNKERLQYFCLALLNRNEFVYVP
ncbi:MAG TPA: DUF1549 and DUF1553 domain-containing protein [Bryobacteraceae bacterium]|nr:DUF1549 and DUF1553 domain-containing protein [Bryobacteraceae bacterium]